MRVLLDTNRYTDFFREREETVVLLEEADEILLPFVVIAELRAGFVQGHRQPENEGALRGFLARPDVVALFPDDQTTHHYAAVCRQLRKQGTPIPTNDIWIAALALQHNLAVHSRDAHFDHLPQLVRA